MSTQGEDVDEIRMKNRTRGRLRRKNSERKSAQVRCTDRRFVRKSDRNFENSWEMIISEHGTTRLKYMRDEPQDTVDALQVQYDTESIIISFQLKFAKRHR